MNSVIPSVAHLFSLVYSTDKLLELTECGHGQHKRRTLPCTSIETSASQFSFGTRFLTIFRTAGIFGQSLRQLAGSATSWLREYPGGSAMITRSNNLRTREKN